MIRPITPSEKGRAALRHLCIFAAAFAILPVTTGTSFAQPAEGSGWYMMHSYMGWGSGIMMILIWGAVVFLLFVLARSLNAMHHNFRHAPQTSIEILKERLARGEIDKAEFEEKRDILLR